MTQAQAGMQECPVVFARSVEVLHEPPKTSAIEVRKCSLHVIPGWRGVVATDHGDESLVYARASRLAQDNRLLHGEQIGQVNDA